MSALDLHRIETRAQDNTLTRLVYDPEADILEIFFGENEPATGIDLTDHIILRLNQQTRRAISLALLHFSILTEDTEFGPRSYPLDHFDELPEDVQALVLQVMTSAPVNRYLKLSYFQASPTERIPLAYVESPPAMAVV